MTRRMSHRGERIISISRAFLLLILDRPRRLPIEPTLRGTLCTVYYLQSRNSSRIDSKRPTRCPRRAAGLGDGASRGRCDAVGGCGARVISSTSQRATAREPRAHALGDRPADVRAGCAREPRAVGRCQVEEMTLRPRTGWDQGWPSRQQIGITPPVTPRHAAAPPITMTRLDGTSRTSDARRIRVRDEEVRRPDP